MVIPAVASGSVVFDNFGAGDTVSPTGHIYFHTSPTGNPNYRSATRIATPFVLNSADTELKSVTVAINSVDSYRSAIQLELWSDSAGKPGSKIVLLDKYSNENYPDYNTARSMRTTFDTPDEIPTGTHLTPRSRYWIVANVKVATYLQKSRYYWQTSPTVAGDISLPSYYRSASFRWDPWSSASGYGAMRIEMVGNDAAQWLNPGDTTGSAGNIDFDFTSIDDEGILSVDPLDINDLTPEEQAAVDFLAPTNPVSLWDIDFDGSFTGPVELTFNYDDTSLLVPESELRIYHRNNQGEWSMLPVVDHDMDANTLTVRTDSFSPFALGAVPEPATMSLLAMGGLALLYRKRR
jgi:hypothetical protein